MTRARDMAKLPGQVSSDDSKSILQSPEAQPGFTASTANQLVTKAQLDSAVTASPPVETDSSLSGDGSSGSPLSVTGTGLAPTVHDHSGQTIAPTAITGWTKDDTTGTISGNRTFTGETKHRELQETVVTLTGATPTVDLELGTWFHLTTSGNTTFTFSNPAASGTASSFTLEITAGGTHTITWPASVRWTGGTAPDAPASGETDFYTFITRDGGTTWYGFQAGDAMA